MSNFISVQKEHVKSNKQLFESIPSAIQGNRILMPVSVVITWESIITKMTFYTNLFVGFCCPAYGISTGSGRYKWRWHVSRLDGKSFRFPRFPWLQDFPTTRDSEKRLVWSSVLRLPNMDQRSFGTIVQSHDEGNARRAFDGFRSSGPARPFGRIVRFSEHCSRAPSCRIRLGQARTGWVKSAQVLSLNWQVHFGELWHRKPLGKVPTRASSSIATDFSFYGCFLQRFSSENSRVHEEIAPCHLVALPESKCNDGARRLLLKMFD